MTGARPDTWMPVYIGDYLADTAHLTRDQHGGYLLLIFAYWRNGGPLPDDDSRMARICKASAKQWRELRPVLAEFFQIEGGVWKHKRIEKELQSSCNAYARRAAAAAKRWSKADAMHEQSQPQSQEEPEGSSEPPVVPQQNGQANGKRDPLTDLGTWEPDQRDRDYAHEQGVDPERIRSDIRSWAANAPPTKRRKRDPRAFWQQWCRREADRRPNRAVGGVYGQGAGRQPASFVAAVRDVLDASDLDEG